MLNTSFPPWPQYAEDEIEAVECVLRSGRVNYWTGSEVRSFESEFAAAVGCSYAVALANGSLALELALRVLCIGPQDEVVVTPRTFIASASCIVLAGARPVFADVDPESQNITADTIAEVISPRTKTIICVHLAGWPCDMDPILDLAQRQNLWVVEDCAQAHGAMYKGRPVGSLGHIAAWSFCQDKIMTTGGEGGMLTTNDASIWEKAWSFKDHGKSWSKVQEKNPYPGFKWLHETFGTNLRLTEMQAAIGRRQLTKLEKWIALRNANALIMSNALRDIPGLRQPEPPNHIRHAYYKYYAFVRPHKLKPDWTRNRILETISEAGIPCGSGVCPEVYREKAFIQAGFGRQERLPGAKALGETSLMFLVHPTFTSFSLEEACNIIAHVLSKASK
ncbi:aminotransferase [candidate division MSBL1 archaeon SCGC-AAA385M11]|nr:aminotransferase [candidate division MSBL1 archaeon SCGC-AAA385M11]